MHDYEPKVTFAVYQDGNLPNGEKFWNPLRHDGVETPPPQGNARKPFRLDSSVTLNIVECDELRRLVWSGRQLEDGAYLLSVETGDDKARGRTMIKRGDEYRVVNVGLYDSGDAGVANKYDNVPLGRDVDFIKKLTETLTDRLGWLQDNKSFASNTKTKKMKAVEEFMTRELKDGLIKCVIKLVDRDPSSWGRRNDRDWIEAVKKVYKTMDKDRLILQALKDPELVQSIKSLSMGEMKEYVARNLLSPKHLNCVVESLFEERGVVAEKCKMVVAKEGRQRKRKLAELQIEPRSYLLYCLAYVVIYRRSSDLPDCRYNNVAHLYNELLDAVLKERKMFTSCVIYREYLESYLADRWVLDE